MDIHFSMLCSCEIWIAIKLTYPGIFGMAGVWHGASLPDLHDKATGSDI